MKTKPVVFNFLFLFFSLIALSLPLQVAFLYEHHLFSFTEWSSILMKLSPMNWLVFTFCLINGILCYQVSPFLKYSIPTSIILVGLNNFIVGSLGVDYHFVLTWIATLTYILLSCSFVYAHGLEAVDNPQKQWWKIPKRYQKTLPVWVQWQGEKKVLAKTFDISKSGAFISSLATSIELAPKESKIGQNLKLFIGTDKEEFEISGILVRDEKRAMGHYPRGLGIRFENLNFFQAFKLKRVLTQLNS